MATWSERRAAIGKIVLALALLGLVGGAFATVAGFLGSLWWGLDLLANFRVQYAFLLAAVLVVLTIHRRWIIGAACAAALLVNLAVVAPLYVGPEAIANPAARPLVLVSFNLNASNRAYEPIARHLRSLDADVLVLLEVTPAALTALTEQLPSYRAVAEPREDNFGIAVFARVAITSHEIVSLGHADLPALDVTLDAAGASYSILAVHPLPPVGRDESAERDRALGAAASWGRRHPNDGVIVGDFNATPWSAAFRALLSASGYQNSQLGHGVQTSWPGALWPMSIPIDHAVHSPKLVTVARSVGPFLGSDHRVLVLRIAPRAN